MNGDTFSIKSPKECSKKFAATFKGKFLSKGNVLRIFFFVRKGVATQVTWTFVVRKVAEFFWEASFFFIRAACLQNETAPEKLLNRYEKRFEKREKRSEKRSETCLKNV